MRYAPCLPLVLLAALVLALPAARPAAGQSANLSTSKADSPDPVPAGGTITYDIVVTNSGPDEATGVTLTDTLPAGTTFLALTTDPDWSCTTPPEGSGGTIDCSLATPLAVTGSAAMTLTVAVDAGLTPGTVIENTATAGAEEGDPDENSDGTASTTVAEPPPGADLSVTKVDDPDPVAAGAELEYTITVTNSGPDAATNASLVDSLPLGTTFVSLPEPPGWTCTTPAPGDPGDILCSIPSLDVGSTVFTLTVAVDPGAAGTELFNTATATSSSDDLDESDNTGSASTTVPAAATPATLSGTKTVSGTFAPGGAVTYTVVLTNSGPDTQGDNPGDELTDVLPAELTLVGATATSGTATPTVATNTVTWNGSLAAGASVTITIDAVIDAGAAPGATISNQGTIAYDADGDGTNEAAAVTDDPGTAAEDDDPTSFQLPEEPVPPPLLIPTLDGLALTVLAALLALGGAWVLRRQLG